MRRSTALWPRRERARFLGTLGFVHPDEAERVAAGYTTVGAAYLALPPVVGVA
ncbi:MAG TPA: hypothetical protein RMH99_19905 [Sandaracinaceae bacterium LLY-WYZ-13_1]|nr:hypothetical protein [Sandaracinaceae bacterium LLY-WYZ-13_1]